MFSDRARALAALTRFLLQGWWDHVRAHRVAYGVLVSVIGGLCFLTVPTDEAAVAWISANRSERMLWWARTFSKWGDLWGTGIVAALVGLAGFWWRSVRLGRVAWAIVLAACLGGGVANVARFGVGRPRPVSKKPDGFYGPTTQFRLLGFPSAHAATAAGTASALGAALPQLAPAMGLLAAGVMWSRIHRRRHHPTDVMVGGLIGVLFGIGLGRAARRAHSVGDER